MREMHVRPSSEFLNSIQHSLEQGNYKAAALQRPYVWEKQDVEDFWESIQGGYPTGSLTIWAVRKEQEGREGVQYRERIGPVTTEPKRYETGLLLDGQNRVATYAWTMYEFPTPEPGQTKLEAFCDSTGVDPKSLSEAEIRTWFDDSTLVIDTVERRVHFVKDDEFDPSTMFKTSTMLNMRAYFNAVARFMDDTILNSDMQWLDHCMNQAREARVGTVVIEDATPKQAARIFKLINKTGHPVTDQDIYNALNLSNVTERPSFESWMADLREAHPDLTQKDGEFRRYYTSELEPAEAVIAYGEDQAARLQERAERVAELAAQAEAAHKRAAEEAARPVKKARKKQPAP